METKNEMEKVVETETKNELVPTVDTAPSVANEFPIEEVTSKGVSAGAVVFGLAAVAGVAFGARVLWKRHKKRKAEREMEEMLNDEEMYCDEDGSVVADEDFKEVDENTAKENPEKKSKK